MNKKYILIGCTLSAVIFGIAYAVNAIQDKTSEKTTAVHSLMIKRSVDEMAKDSKATILGTVEKISVAKEPSFVRRGEDDIMTTAVVRVERYLINPEGLTSDVITIKTIGGTVGDITMRAGTAATFTAGERIVAFLEEKERNVFTVYGGAQGKYTVNPDGSLGNESEKEFLEITFGKKDVTLDEFKARVASDQKP